jgi:ketosteroid isomerase-like protein
MTESSALALASTFLDAWTAGDVDTARSVLADDFAFDGPVAHYRSAAEFLAGSRDFVAGIRPVWTRICAFGDDREALLLYDLHLRSGQPMRIADHHVVRQGQIQAERILFDRGAMS